MHEAEAKADASHVLGDSGTEEFAPFRGLRVRADEQQKEDGGAEVGVELVFARHPVRDGEAECHVARSVVVGGVDGVAQEVKGQ